MARVVGGLALITMGVFAGIAGVLTLNPAFIMAAVSLIGMGSSLMAGGFKHAQTITNQMMVRQPISYRRIIYGNVRAGGVLTYAGLSGSNNEYMHLVLTIAGHELTSIGQVYFEGQLAQYDTGSPTGLIQYPYYDLEIDLGNPSNSSQPFPHLAAAIPDWNSECLQQGCAKAHITLKYDLKVYPNGIPSSIAFDVQGKAIYDPRSSTTAYSNNPALVIRDFLTDSRYGLGAAAATIDDSFTIAAANICDEQIAVAAANQATIGECTQVVILNGIGYISATNNLKVGQEVTFSNFTYATFLNGITAQVVSVSAASFPGHGTGGYAAGQGFAISFNYANFGHVDTGTATASSTQATYTCDGVFDAGQPRGNVLVSLASSMAGFIIPPGDMWRIIAGAYVTPTVILTQDDFRGPVKMDTLVSKRELANCIQGTFVSPANQWQSSNYPPYVSATAIAEDGGTRIWQTVDLPFTTDGVRTQRIAKIYLERIRQQISLTLACKLTAFMLQPGDTVMVTFAPFGFNEEIFEVVQCQLAQDAQRQEDILGVGQDGGLGTDGNSAPAPQVPTLGVNLSLRQTNSAVYSWNPATDENTWTQPAQVNLESQLQPEPVTGVSATSGSGTAIVRQDGLIQDRILVAWTSPADEYVLNGGKIQVWISPHGAGTFTLAGEADGSDTQFYVLNVVDGSLYDVRVTAINAAKVAAPYVEVDGIEASGGTTYFTGTVNPALSGMLPNGTMPPAQLNTGFTYTSNTNSITWSWSGLHIYRMTLATQSVPNGSQPFTGLSSGTEYYAYPAWDDATSAIYWVYIAGGVGSPAWLYTSAFYASDGNILSIYQNQQTNIALSVGPITAATTSSGTGGGSGGGGGTCLREDMIVETSQRGSIRAIDVLEGEHLAGADGWTQVVEKRVSWQDTFIEICTSENGRIIVTPHHPMILADGSEKAASCLTLLDVLKTRAGADSILGLRVIHERAAVVSLRCAPAHTFYAGEKAANLLTHNFVVGC